MGAAISVCSFKLELDLFYWNTFGDGRVTKNKNALTKIYIQRDGLLSPVHCWDVPCLNSILLFVSVD